MGTVVSRWFATSQMCTKSDQHSLTEKQFQVKNDEIERFLVPGGTGGKVEYSVSTTDQRIRSKGEISLCDDNGISIISDIVSISRQSSKCPECFDAIIWGGYHQNDWCGQRSECSAKYFYGWISLHTRNGWTLSSLRIVVQRDIPWFKRLTGSIVSVFAWILSNANDSRRAHFTCVIWPGSTRSSSNSSFPNRLSDRRRTS